jgi:hypothetical protein
LEHTGQPSETVAAFLMRCLFTMFSEDVGLLPTDSFKSLLEECERTPPVFVPLVSGLWQDMNRGSAFSATIRARVAEVLDTLVALGQARRDGEAGYAS